MGRRAETTLAVGGLFKQIVLTLGSLAIFALAILSFVKGSWLFGVLLIFIGEPVWFFLADLATGILLLPFVGMAALRDRSDRS